MARKVWQLVWVGEPGRPGPALDHPQDIVVGDPLCGELPLAVQGPEERGRLLAGDAGGRDVGVEEASALWCAGTSWNFPPFSWSRSLEGRPF